MSFLSLECVYKIITLLGGCLRFLIWRKIIIWRIFDILFDQNIFTSLNKKYFQKLNWKKIISKNNFQNPIFKNKEGLWWWFLVTFFGDVFFMRCEFGRRWIWVSCGSQQGMRMIGLDWLILDWCIGCFWETNMERAYHTSKTLKVNYVHHASFWWNHYIIHINRSKKLSQVSPNWPILFQTDGFY